LAPNKSITEKTEFGHCAFANLPGLLNFRGKSGLALLFCFGARLGTCLIIRIRATP
jgi:hypothetical protein